MYKFGVVSLLSALVGLSKLISCGSPNPKFSWDISRIVAVGDLHGDHQNAVKVLKMAKVIDKDLKWAGGNHTILVQTGDVVDRGPDAFKLFKMLQRLEGEARQAGGRVTQD